MVKFYLVALVEDEVCIKSLCESAVEVNIQFIAEHQSFPMLSCKHCTVFSTQNLLTYRGAAIYEHHAISRKCPVFLFMVFAATQIVFVWLSVYHYTMYTYSLYIYKQQTNVEDDADDDLCSCL